MTLCDTNDLGCTEGIEAVHECDADVDFGGLTVGVSCHDALAECLWAAHLRLDPAPGVVACPALPEGAPVTACDPIALPPERVPVLALHTGESCVLGIRPEHTSEDPGTGPGIEMEVGDVEPLGPRTLLVGRDGEAKFTGQTASSTKSRSGERRSIHLDRTKMHFFRGDDGRAIR